MGNNLIGDRNPGQDNVSAQVLLDINTINKITDEFIIVGKSAAKLNNTVKIESSVCTKTGTDNKLLVLGLDGTLIDRMFVNKKCQYAPSCVINEVHKVYKRPNLDGFLEFCFKHFRVGLVSLATEKNVDKMVHHLLLSLAARGGTKYNFEFIYTRADILLDNRLDLHELLVERKKYDTKQMLIVSNSEEYNIIDSFIKIPRFLIRVNPNDNELCKIQATLSNIIECE